MKRCVCVHMHRHTNIQGRRGHTQVSSSRNHLSDDGATAEGAEAEQLQTPCCQWEGKTAPGHMELICDSDSDSRRAAASPPQAAPGETCFMAGTGGCHVGAKTSLGPLRGTPLCGTDTGGCRVA